GDGGEAPLGEKGEETRNEPKEPLGSAREAGGVVEIEDRAVVEPPSTVAELLGRRPGPETLGLEGPQHRGEAERPGRLEPGGVEEIEEPRRRLGVGPIVEGQGDPAASARAPPDGEERQRALGAPAVADPCRDADGGAHPDPPGGGHDGYRPPPRASISLATVRPASARPNRRAAAASGARHPGSPRARASTRASAARSAARTPAPARPS